ncbi:MAG: zf-HC2 domain-containing protein [Elusimicrobiota bacterium]
MTAHVDGPELSAYLDGALAPEPRARIVLHMSSCADCRAELDSLRHLKLALSSAPRKRMPADLALALERRFASGARPWYAPLTKPMIWAPAGALTVAVTAVSLWLRFAATLDEIPLEPLLAAHARYSAEALVHEDNLVASNYLDQLNDLPDASESEIQ